jgi:hypothetical protein
MPDYLIITKLDSDTKTERIVRAKNAAAALKHVVADTITLRAAAIDDAMRLANAGGKVEVAE